MEIQGLGDRKSNDPEQNLSAVVRVVLVLFTVFVVVTVFLYVKFWHVTDRSKQILPIRQRVETAMDEGNILPQKDNSFYLIEQAGRNLRLSLDPASTEPDKWVNDAQEKGVSADDLPNLKKLMELNTKVLLLLDQGSDLPEFVVPIDYKSGYTAKSIDYFTFLKLSRFLLMIGQGEALQGNTKEALRRYLQTLRISTGLRKNGTLISLMVSVAISLKTYPYLLKLMPELAEDPQSGKKVLKELLELRKAREPLEAYLENELVVGLNTFDYLRTSSGRKKLSQQISTVMHIPGFVINREEKLFENWFLDVMEILKKPHAEVGPALGSMELPKASVMTNLIIPNILRIYAMHTHDQVIYDGLLIQAALGAYQRDHKTYPESLDQLVPDYLPLLPRDPYSSSGSFVYRREGESFILYSVGPDLTDDGGRISTDFSDIESTGDLIFKSRK